ncbi:hypothetical protein DFP72DRAFT_10549 [Ephemerocybe angulata]|uniref:RING-type domain-containing protein n=1 Tax=Ephemerocybe angulata TaxID=980116 RepID=A0A8H6IKC6_9AGAR|nr:hypothetical protein DFP72DRAFT_10549 [Tulosesus angulatus]
MEDEYTCSVCCDILAAAHIANPCGHSFCGDCGYQWVSVAKKSTCPICRTHLSVSAQLIPNVALESAVGKYVELLGVAGHNGWRSGGNLHKDWLERKEMWKIQALAREKKHPPEDQPGTNVQQVIDLTRVFFDRSSPIRDDGSDLIPVAPPTYRSHRPFARTRSSRAVLLPNI